MNGVGVRLLFPSLFSSLISISLLQFQLSFQTSYLTDIKYGFPSSPGRREGEVPGGTIGSGLQLSTRRSPPPLKGHNPQAGSDQSPLTRQEAEVLRFAKSHSSTERGRGATEKIPEPGALCSSGHLIPSSLLPDFQDQQTDPGEQRRRLGSPSVLTQAPAGTKGTKRPGAFVVTGPARKPLGASLVFL